MQLGATKLQELKKKLKEMYNRSFCAIPGVYSVEWTDGPDGDFFVTFHYRARDKTQRMYRRHFDNECAFGDTCHGLDQNAWRYRFKVCRFGSETIDLVLRAMDL